MHDDHDACVGAVLSACSSIVVAGARTRTTTHASTGHSSNGSIRAGTGIRTWHRRYGSNTYIHVMVCARTIYTVVRVPRARADVRAGHRARSDQHIYVLVFANI